MLEALAETIRSELSFHVVAVNLLDAPRQRCACVTVLGDDDARRTLLGTVSPWAEWEPRWAPDYRARRGGLAARRRLAGSDESARWTPRPAAAPGPDGWHPDDMLLLPLRGQDGDILGVVSVDQPASGRRPDDEQITSLMTVPTTPAIGVEQSLRDTAHSAAAAEQSSELRLAAVMLLAETLDLRDPGTAPPFPHRRRLRPPDRGRLDLAPDRVDRIHAAGVLHDLGKLGIADAILYKPGAARRLRMAGDQAPPRDRGADPRARGAGGDRHWVSAHHERIDGPGYPGRSATRRSPLEARSWPSPTPMRR